MRLRDAINFYPFSPVMLIEANQYLAMFSKITTPPKDLDKNSLWAKNTGLVENNINQEIQWTQRILKRKDRIVWYLRWYRGFLIAKLQDTTVITELTSLIQKSQEPATNYTVQDIILIISSGTLRRQLEHFMGMQIPAIQNYQFAWQTPQKLINDLTQIERQWRAEQAKREEEKKQILQQGIQPGDKPLIEFPDGFVWWLLARGGCPDEARSMGHCGNGQGRPGERIVSLRKSIKRVDSVGWRPSLTFILDKNGYLGEMKGRGNDKPAPQYHPYIVKLLLNPIIKGIKGGGYLPEHNFHFSDLSQEEQDQIIQAKPALAPFTYQLNKFGARPHIVKKIIAALQSADLLVAGDVLTLYDKTTKSIIVENFKSVDDYVHAHGSEFLQRCAKQLEGGEEFNWFDADFGADDNDARQLYDKFFPKWGKKINKYVKFTYPDEYKEAKEGGIDDDSLWEILFHNNDDIVSQLKRAVNDGRRHGTESELYKDFMDAIKDVPNEVPLTPVFTMYDHKGETGIVMDGEVKMILSLKDAANILDNPGVTDEEIANSGWWQNTELSIEEPHYGWSGYDEESALEIGEDYLSEILG